MTPLPNLELHHGVSHSRFTFTFAQMRLHAYIRVHGLGSWCSPTSLKEEKVSLEQEDEEGVVCNSKSKVVYDFDSVRVSEHQIAMLSIMLSYSMCCEIYQGFGEPFESTASRIPTCPLR